MKHALISILTASAFCLASSSVSAATAEDIRRGMANGDFAAAFVQANELQSAEGFALAAESLLSEIMLGQAEKNKKQAKRARKLAEAGLELDPSNQNARLQFALADGFVARETGDVSAWMKKLPQKTQAIVQAYRDDFPDDPRGDALLGAWHLTIARKAGGRNAEKWFGVDIAEGQKLFQSTHAVRPNDIVVGVNYAFSLLALADEDFSDVEESHQILKAVSNIHPEDHMGRVLKGYAEEALGAIENRDIVRSYAVMFLEGKVPELPSDG